MNLIYEYAQPQMILKRDALRDLSIFLCYFIRKWSENKWSFEGQNLNTISRKPDV